MHPRPSRNCHFGIGLGIELATNYEFKKRRREFYDCQTYLLERGRKPEQILKDLDQLIVEFNAQALVNGRICRWETVFTVLTVAGAAMTAWVGFNPTAPAAGLLTAFSAVTTAGPAVWTKLQPREAIGETSRIAVGGAMFHQIEACTGFQFRTFSQRSKQP